MKKTDFKNSSFIIFIVISILYLISNIIWYEINTPIIPHGDSALHFLDIFSNSVFYFNAPLMTWIMKGMFFIFGKECFDLQIILVNYIFFLVALYFIYKLGLELKDKETGNIAMILFALTPAVYGMSRQYGHKDWHVMVAMVVNIYCLIKLDYFKDRKWSIIYGISVGLGLLIKDEFLVYFFTPWLYVVIMSLKEETNLKKIKNIITTIITGALIAGSHCFRIRIIEKILNDPIIETSPVFSFESLRITTIGLSEYLLSPPIFVLFLVGLVWFLFKYKNKYKYMMLLWFLIPWIIITFMPHHKLPEYCYGFITDIIIIISLWIRNIKNFLIKIFLIFCMLICFLQFLDFSFNFEIFSTKINYKNHEIFYYDKKYPYIMGYEKNKYLFAFMDYYKNNFADTPLFFLNFILYDNLDIFDIQAYLNIKNIENYQFMSNLVRSSKTNIISEMQKTMILVFTEEYSIKDINFLFKREKYGSELYRVKYDENTLFKQCLLFSNEINEKYMQIDEFYLNPNDKRPENHIYVLGKKELFENKENIIRYPYKIK